MMTTKYETGVNAIHGTIHLIAGGKFECIFNIAKEKINKCLEKGENTNEYFDLYDDIICFTEFGVLLGTVIFKGC